MAQFHSRRTGGGSLDDKCDDGTVFEGFHQFLVRLEKEGIDEFFGFEEHDAEGWCEDFGIVPLSPRGKFAFASSLVFGGWRGGGGRAGEGGGFAFRAGGCGSYASVENVSVVLEGCRRRSHG